LFVEIIENKQVPRFLGFSTEAELALGSAKRGLAEKSTKKLRGVDQLAACDTLPRSREPKWKFRLKKDVRDDYPE
jgi:hypothetical protein